jgi:hypothetical protein
MSSYNNNVSIMAYYNVYEDVYIVGYDSLYCVALDENNLLEIVFTSNLIQSIANLDNKYDKNIRLLLSDDTEIKLWDKLFIASITMNSEEWEFLDIGTDECRLYVRTVKDEDNAYKEFKIVLR